MLGLCVYARRSNKHGDANNVYNFVIAMNAQRGNQWSLLGFQGYMREECGFVECYDSWLCYWRAWERQLNHLKRCKQVVYYGAIRVLLRFFWPVVIVDLFIKEWCFLIVGETNSKITYHRPIWMHRSSIGSCWFSCSCLSVAIGGQPDSTIWRTLPGACRIHEHANLS